MPVEKLFAQWRVVNEQANDAERRLFETSMNYLRGKGPPPADVDRAKAAQLRAEARTLFARALQEVDLDASDARKGIMPQPAVRGGPDPASSGSAAA